MQYIYIYITATFALTKMNENYDDFDGLEFWVLTHLWSVDTFCTKNPDPAGCSGVSSRPRASQDCMSLTRWALVGSGLRGTIRSENLENVAGNRFVVFCAISGKIFLAAQLMFVHHIRGIIIRNDMSLQTEAILWLWVKSLRIPNIGWCSNDVYDVFTREI